MNNNMKPIALINHGCAKNLVDSELILGLLYQNGYKVTLDDSEAPIVIVNTCSFINDAEKESIASIFKMINAGKKVIITGCLPQKYKNELQKLIPEACAFLGTSDLEKIVDVIKNIDTSSNFKVSDNPKYNYPESVQRLQITVGASSYIKIAEGCDFNCGYCIIPKLRGPYKSRTIENIVNEAQLLAEKGVNEIVLIAQDTTSYGKDIYGTPKLAELLTKLNEIQNLSWIRIMYMYPSFITDELLKTIAKLSKVVKYIDIPLQHVSKNQLELMSRPLMDYKKLIKTIRAIIPSCAIRTTFIVGYPNETEDDFNELCNFVETMKLDRVGVFEFSREKETKADKLKPQINAKIKHQRKKKLMEIQQGVSKEINKNLIGKNIDCIVEAITPQGILIGRTYKDAPEVDGLIYIKTDKEVIPGDIITAKITDAKEYDLEGIF